MDIIKYNKDFKDRLKVFLDNMYGVMGYSFPPEERALDLDTIYEKCIESGGEFLALFNGQEVIGSIGVKITDKAKGIGEVKRLFVMPQYQGNGYGKLLLNELINLSKERGLKILRLCTTPKSDKAIKLYRKTGFYYIKAYKDIPVVDIFMEMKIG